jgi:DNA-binding NarL/FixJ family response regulator
MTIRVLLADDHALLREGLRALLTAHPGIAVVAEVGDGREALRRTEELRPDVLVMDVSMPLLNGIEAALLVRARCPETQIVMLSMHSSNEHVFRALRAGALGYVLKESAATEVIAAVQAVRAGQRYLSPTLREAAAAMEQSDRPGPLESLSARERQVLQLVVEGKSSAEIARLVHLSPKTVETYRSRLMKKLGVPDVPSLVKFAIQHGLTPPG